MAKSAPAGLKTPRPRQGESEKKRRALYAHSRAANESGLAWQPQAERVLRKGCSEQKQAHRDDGWSMAASRLKALIITDLYPPLNEHHPAVDMRFVNP